MVQEVKDQELLDAVEDQVASTHGANPCIIEKERLYSVVTETVAFILENRDRLMKEAAAEQEILLDKIRKGDATQQFLEPPSRYLAEKLYDVWKNAPADVLVIEGRCTHLLHQWFEVRGLPEKLEEPNYKFIIDPNPLGIHTGVLLTNAIAATDQYEMLRLQAVVFEPYSVWQEAYTGKVIRGEEVK